MSEVIVDACFLSHLAACDVGQCVDKFATSIGSLSVFSPYFKIFVSSSPLLLFRWKNLSLNVRMSDGGENAHNEKRMASVAPRRGGRRGTAVGE